MATIVLSPKRALGLRAPVKVSASPERALTASEVELLAHRRNVVVELFPGVELPSDPREREDAIDALARGGLS